MLNSACGRCRFHYEFFLRSTSPRKRCGQPDPTMLPPEDRSRALFAYPIQHPAFCAKQPSPEPVKAISGADSGAMPRLIEVRPSPICRACQIVMFCNSFCLLLGANEGKVPGYGLRKDANFPVITGGRRRGLHDGSITPNRAGCGPPQPRPHRFSLHLGTLGICCGFVDWDLLVFVTPPSQANSLIDECPPERLVDDDMRCWNSSPRVARSSCR
jgi:hypothetical protein